MVWMMAVVVDEGRDAGLEINYRAGSSFPARRGLSLEAIEGEPIGGCHFGFAELIFRPLSSDQSRKTQVLRARKSKLCGRCHQVLGCSEKKAEQYETQTCKFSL